MIKIVVLGTSGVNFINRFKEEEISCFELISICSNKEILESSKADKKLFVGDCDFGCESITASSNFWTPLFL